MMEIPIERKRDGDAKPQFLLTGFTQTAGIRSYAFEGRVFEGRVEARRIYFTVEVDLALIPGYGIRIQDLPLMCRELLEQAGTNQISALVFTEQYMRILAEKLALEREEAGHRKKHRFGA